MSDPQQSQNGDPGIDATGVDADFVTNDPDPAPDEATPGPEQVSGDGDGDADDPDFDLSDLP
ncbi:hypothetical protein [Microbacterium sp. NPDC089695]|uniref:hypothetical protein n=1 Tax=Microbacterium sp. NPDC089695 TaxID=3364198 RepID=UPI0038191136